MNLVIDEGNTTVKVAVFESKEEPEEVFTYKSPDTREIIEAIRKYPIKSGIYSTVAAYNSTLVEQIKKIIPHVIDLTHATPLPIKINYGTPDTLGVDRIAGAVAAWSKSPHTDSFIIDAGTAITYDHITSQGEYLGGNISPGITMRLKSLNHYTTSLPLITKSPTYPQMGYDTPSAILSGVMTGVISEVKAYIQHYRNKIPDINVIITGGDSCIIYDNLKPAQESGITEDNLLVLKGLNKILNYNNI